jgi:hypothetical protein
MNITNLEYKQPQFEFVDYDFTGMSFWQRFRFVCKNPPRVKLVADWKLAITFNHGKTVTLYFKKGFVTDLASIPRVAWHLPGFSPFGPLRVGAIPHDFGYQHGYLQAIEDGHIVNIFNRPQEFFDELMARVVQKENDSWFISNIAWFMLRLFGRKAWSKYRNNGPGAYGVNSLGLPGIDYNGNLRTWVEANEDRLLAT